MHPPIDINTRTLRPPPPVSTTALATHAHTRTRTRAHTQTPTPTPIANRPTVQPPDASHRLRLQLGILRSLEENEDFAETFTGTMLYMSPERVEGEAYSCIRAVVRSRDFESGGRARILVVK